MRLAICRCFPGPLLVLPVPVRSAHREAVRRMPYLCYCSVHKQNFDNINRTFTFGSKRD